MKETAIKYRKPIIAGVLLLVLVLGYFYRDKWMGLFSRDENPSTTDKVTSTSSSTNSSSSSSNVIDKDKVLKRGDKGVSVEELQRLMNAELKNHTPTLLEYLVVDGVFGPKTEEMLMHITRGDWDGQKKSISINAFLAAFPQ